LNVTVTMRASFMLTVQIFVEVVSHPVQLLKDEPASGVAIRFTLVPGAKSAPHVDGQVMPGGVLVIVPVPPPAVLTESGIVAPTVSVASPVTSE
jgi:hypothetical protein